MTTIYLIRHSQPFRKLLGEYNVNEVEQIRNFDSFNRIEWKNLATNRRKYTFQQLYAGDRASHAWDAIVSHNSQLYGIRPKQMVKYIMPEDDKLLFEERKGHHI